MALSEDLKRTFNNNAEIYEKMRPGYPEELYRDILSYVPVGASSHVLEIGIGGGQATLPFLKTGCRLTAVEYGETFTALCRRKFAEHPNFSAVTCAFEDFSCRENSFDLIYSASAFHWIPEKTGYEKVFRCLKHGGAFARFANRPYMDKGNPALSDAIQKIYDKYMPNSQKPREFSYNDASALSALPGKYGFINTTFNLYSRTRSFTAGQYISLLGTYSDHLILENDLRRRFFTEIRDTINSFGGCITIYDTVDLELARKP